MGRQRYTGKWEEPISTKIALPFTVAYAVQVLRWGTTENAPYNHQDIAHWCERFWNAYCDVDAPTEIESILPVLADVETQWDLYLANTYRITELRSINFDDVALPKEWFHEWLVQIGA